MGNTPLTANEAKVQFEDLQRKRNSCYQNEAEVKLKSMTKKIVQKFLKSNTSCLRVILQIDGRSDEYFYKNKYPTFRFEYESHLNVLKSNIESFGYVCWIGSIENHDCYFWYRNPLFQNYRICHLVICFDQNVLDQNKY
jgi:hypothetical protein